MVSVKASRKDKLRNVTATAKCTSPELVLRKTEESYVQYAQRGGQGIAPTPIVSRGKWFS